MGFERFFCKKAVRLLSYKLRGNIGVRWVMLGQAADRAEKPRITCLASAGDHMLLPPQHGVNGQIATHINAGRWSSFTIHTMLLAWLEGR
jgi:hypothetical protein